MFTPDLLVESTLRVTVLIVITGGLSLLLRRVPAATHHWLWLLTVTAVTIMPLWLAFSLEWSVSLFTQPAKTPSSASESLSQYYALEGDTASPPSQVNTAPSSTTTEGQTNAPAVTAAEDRPAALTSPAIRPASSSPVVRVSSTTIALMVWLGGALLCLGYWLYEWVSLLKIVRQGMVLHDRAWIATVQSAAHLMGVKQPVRLILSNQITIPMAWGFRRPAILLPMDAPNWTPSRRQMVLTHELAHIKRGDLLTQWIGLVSCAVHWFNPLVWWTQRRLSVECERACDDRVLSLGIHETEYASQLVDMARSILHFRGSIKAFAHKAELSLRVRNILNSHRNRRALSWKRSFSVALGYVVLVSLPIASITPGLNLPHAAGAKQSETTLLLSVPGYMSSFLPPSALQEFEESHNIHVVLNPFDNTIAAAPDGYYQSMEQLANSGDVILIESQITSDATLAGYFLDLSPMTNLDSSLDIDDFFPAVWQSYQWDGGIWALPTYWSMAVMTYLPSAFDAVGLAYPSEQWTVDDLINAIRLLKTDDSYGLEMLPYLRDFPLLISLLGESLNNTLVVPNQPRFDNPKLAALLEQWNQFQSENLIGPDMSKAVSGTLEDLMNPNAPMQIVAMGDISPRSSRQIVPLPGGHASVILSGGVAVSAGTQHPEEAYELAKFLTTRPETFSIYGSSVAPARQSLFHSDANNFADELQPVFEELAANAVPISEQRYQVYISLAIGQISRDDIAQTLQAANPVTMADKLAVLATVALADQDNALAHRGTFTLNIPVPVAVEIPEGKVALKFGLQSLVQPLPNQEIWDRVRDDFTANDPDVGYVDLFMINGPIDATSEYDCVYSPFPLSTSDTINMLDLSPLMAADPEFDRSDFLPGTLDRVSQGALTYGYPLTVQPQVLAYNIEKFQQAGVPLPSNNWTTSDFVSTLKDMNAATGEPVMSTNFGIAEHLFILTEAFGGQPILMQAGVPIVDFTSPQTVEAVRNVLDLVREGYIGYRSAQDSGRSLNITDDPALMTVYLDPLVGMISGGMPGWSYVFYPAGTSASVGIGVGAAYISPQAANPEACYRWIATLSKNATLLMAMPARTSAINDPTLRAAHGDNAVDLYRQLDALMRKPGTQISQTAFGGENINIGYLKYWLYRAFDAYVLDDQPIEEALADAQIIADAYLGCVAQISPDLVDGAGEYYAAYHDCAVKADSEYPY
ncbi:MAG TPA: extracellular solute-binding protein [Aggregatilineaceae bacterium]|nr:extracellular solute-binding protein [Aggregatilineaceae bacterium]